MTGGPDVAVVVLTMANRPVELERAVRSVLDQRGPPADVLVVGNGADVVPPAGGVRTLRLPENLGIPGGRDVGWRQTDAEVVLFLDDDAWLLADDVLERVRAAYAAQPRLGIVTMRIVDPATGLTARRHVPRLRAADPLRSSEVTTFLGGVAFVRRAVLEECGGLPGEFWYAHEETDLAWKALDAGWTIRYDADAVAGHPTTAPARHATYFRLNARNRVWLARRNLPAPLVPVYLGVWAALTTLRVRDVRLLRTWWAGFVEGWRTDPGARRPMSWRTVLRMTRLGRPPVI